MLFRLNILLCLTRPDSQTPKAFTEKVHNRYVILMQRRLSHLQANGKFPYAKLVRIIYRVKISSKIFQAFSILFQGLTANEAFSTIMSRHKNLTHIASYLLQVFKKAHFKVPSYSTRALEVYRPRFEDMEH